MDWSERSAREANSEPDHKKSALFLDNNIGPRVSGLVRALWVKGPRVAGRGPRVKTVRAQSDRSACGEKVRMRNARDKSAKSQGE